MLTGKALKDFIEYHYNQVDFTKESHEENYELFLANTEDTHQLASIIEWLDSVGIYVDIEFFRKDIKDEAKFVAGTTDSKNGFRTLGEEFNSRQQATEKAIERAVEIYNSK